LILVTAAPCEELIRILSESSWSRIFPSAIGGPGGCLGFNAVIFDAPEAHYFT
jgi:hypothetical protein